MTPSLPSTEPQGSLPILRRLDLVLTMTGSADTVRWTVKDPIAERFYQLHEQEYFVFHQLDGQRSIADIQHDFQLRYAPQQLSDQQVILFVQKLFDQGLVLIEKPGAWLALTERAEKLKEVERKQRWTNLLAIRFPGINPNKFLSRLMPLVNWCFSPATVFASVCLFLVAVTVVFAEWDQITRELPSFQTFLRSSNFFLFLAAISIVKILHEFAHAFACKRFGGDCREIGILLLAFTPCLYCNVSDAWLLQNRWHRIVISAAGMYLELVLGSLCALFWIWSQPGVLHTLCLYLMVISSVSTLFLNGNPLLRYDGYYILSDLVEIPNLRQRAQELVKGWWQCGFYGFAAASRRTLQPTTKWFLGMYGMLSMAYVWFVIFAILWMLYNAAKPFGLEPLVILFGVVMLTSKLSQTISSQARFASQLHRLNLLKWPRTLGMLSLGLVILLGFLNLQITRRINSPCLIQPHEETIVYITSPGEIDFQSLSVGQSIQKGDLLANLSNLPLNREVRLLENKVQRQEKKIALLQLRQTESANASADLPTAVVALQDYLTQFAQKKEEFNRLSLRASRQGIILPGANRNQSSGPTELKRTGTLLEPRNQGAWVEAGEILCRIAEESKRDAVLYVEQAEAVLLTSGMTVKIVIPQFPHIYFQGAITQVASEPLEEIPPVLLREELIPYQADNEGRLRSAVPIHEVRITLNTQDSLIHFGQTGRASIRLSNESILDWIMRSVRSTLTFQF